MHVARRSELESFEHKLLHQSRSYRQFESNDRLESPRDDGLGEMIEGLILVHSFRSACAMSMPMTMPGRQQDDGHRAATLIQSISRGNLSRANFYD